ncbi:MAG: GAF domain-containing protein, partial [Chloroflexota bacterium]|nr:GAF domain-containing protein [Chloroflexota bacterium]
ETLRRGQPVIVADARADTPEARAYRAALGPGRAETAPGSLRSWMALPLLVQERAIGLLALSHTAPNFYTPRHAALTMAIANQAAVALENARLYEQTERDLRRQDALREVIEQISAELDFDRLLHTILASAVELLGADVGSLGLVDERGEVSRIRATHNIPEELRLGEMRAGQGLIGMVLREHRPVLVDDYAEVADPLPGVDYRSCLGVPIWERGRLVGTFFVGATDPARRFGPRDVETLELFAKHAALAIGNARLYSALQERLSQVEGLSAVGTALVEERDLGRVLRIVGERVVALLDADGCSIALLDPDEAARRPGEELELAVVIGPNEEQLQGRRLPLTGSFSGEAIRTGGPVLSEDAPRDPRGFAPTIQMGEVKSALVVPLQTRERVVGALNVHAIRGSRRFGRRDIDLLTLFAQQAAVAIENARLYQRAQGLAALEERQRLARELHDSVSQALYGVALGARTARTLLDRDPGRVAPPLDYVLSLAEAGLAEMRALIFELRPESLATEGLVAALDKQTASLRARHGLDVRAELGDEPAIPLEGKEALYRIAQEALHNTVKHARARTVAVRLACDGDVCTLEVSDDGAGFDPRGSFPGHLGLHSMRERTARLGGTLEIASAPGEGTHLRARLPLQPAG